MIDATTKAGARAIERLGSESIAWLTTVNAAGQAQSSPIWFLWTGSPHITQETGRRVRTARAVGRGARGWVGRSPEPTPR
jgi:hypothetical protein